MHQLGGLGLGRVVVGGGWNRVLLASVLGVCALACSTPDKKRDVTGSSGAGGSAVIAGTGGHSGDAGSAGTSGTGGAGGSGGAGGTAGMTAGSSGGLPPFDAGSEPNRNKVTAGHLCDRLSTIQCASELHCCNNPGRSKDRCKSDMLDVCTRTLAFDAISADPITNFDMAAAEAAFTQFEQLASQCNPSVTAWGLTAGGLRGILKGTRAPGADCTPQTTNAADTAKIGAALASCTNLDTTACLPNTIPLTWSCSPKNGAGGSCVTDVNCNDPLYCDNPQMAIGKCATRKPAGSACTNPNECDALFCKGKMCVASGVQPAYCLLN